jgi:site-specific recombinase XerD
MNVNSYYTRPWILNRYFIGPLASHLTPFSDFLVKQGYSYATGQRYVREVGHLSRWLDRQGVSIAELSEEIIRTYLCFRYQNNHLQVKKWPYRHLLNYLQQTGIVGIQKPVEMPSDQCIDRYQDHMVRNQGLEKETIRVRIRVARKFLSLHFGENSLELSDLLPRHIEQYFLNRSHHCNTTTLKTEASALRCFLRFLQFRGDISVHLVDSVPTVPSWRHTTIPEFLTTDEINRLIQNCECETPQGQRDIAILLLLIRLGLRAIEICRLTLNDINWDAGFINILGKNGKRDRLPLLHDVGEAISNYLCHGRPQCSTRYVFVRAIAPFEPFSSSSSVANVVRNALRRANLNPARKGSHRLRRSLATMMLQEGASLTEIGQILRHQKADTTAIYAKVDLGRLRPIARPWPEGGDQ